MYLGTATCEGHSKCEVTHSRNWRDLFSCRAWAMFFAPSTPMEFSLKLKKTACVKSEVGCFCAKIETKEVCLNLFSIFKVASIVWALESALTGRYYSLLEAFDLTASIFLTVTSCAISFHSLPFQYITNGCILNRHEQKKTHRMLRSSQHPAQKSSTPVF